MESIVKMGVKPVRDNRNVDSVQEGQSSGPESDQYTAKTGEFTGTEYDLGGRGNPGRTYSSGGTAASGTAAGRMSSASGNAAGKAPGYGNTGYAGAGYGNTGYANTGYGNTGCADAGYGNTGYANTGYGNTGCADAGYENTAYGSSAHYGTAAGETAADGTGDGGNGTKKDADSAKSSDEKAASAKSREKKAPDPEKLLARSRKKKYRMIAEYAVVTIVFSYILIHMADNLGIILKMAGKAAQTIGMLLTPLFWGFVVAYVLSPAVDFFEKRFQRNGVFEKKSSRRRGAAVAMTYVLTLLFLIVVFSIVASALSRSLRVASLEDLVIMIETIGKSFKNIQTSIQDWLLKMNISSNEVAAALSEVGEQAARFTSGLSKSVTGTVTQIGGLLTSSVFVIIFSIYFLLDKEGILRYWKRVITAIGGKKTRGYCKVLVDDADAVFSGYIRGQLIDAFIMAILVSVALQLIGLKYAIIIGILSGIGNLIPYLGPVVAYGSTTIACLFGGDWKRLIVAIVVLFVIQTIDGNVINPHLLSSNIDVHPMLVIAALIIGGATGGFVGMLFAVPVAAFLKLQFDKVIYRLLQIRMPEMAVETMEKKTAEKKTTEKKTTEKQRPVKRTRSAKNISKGRAAGNAKRSGNSAAKNSLASDVKSSLASDVRNSPADDAKKGFVGDVKNSSANDVKNSPASDMNGGAESSAKSRERSRARKNAKSGAKNTAGKSAVSRVKDSVKSQGRKQLK